MPGLEIQNLTKDYGHERGIFDVTFKVEKRRGLWLSWAQWCEYDYNYTSYNL
jgi:hypothetical protein